MGTLRTLWQKLTGNESAPEATARKPAVSAQPKVKEGLHLVDDSPGTRPSRPGAAGFDPYSSDAGYSKPHTWERVDHD
ncbi:MAG: hypothetical protein WBO04_05850 [Steroidobacteraceae bacterium]